MKIGILGCFFNCSKDLNRVIEPFIDLRASKNLVLTAVNSVFKENAELGMSADDDKTRLKISNAGLDYHYFSPVPLAESQARNKCLDYLLYTGVDFVWILDGDEFYTKEQISQIIYFIEKNKDNEDCFFSIPFKNHVFEGAEWVDGFCPPRIFNNNIHDGIDQFYWDNDILYRDGTNYKVLQEIAIPKEIAHVRHMTWLHENGKEKYEYQVKHFGQCSYKWNYEEEKLEFDKEYYEKHGIPIPKLEIG
jgi:hypothetical protein